jgi:hypothetical protein
MFQIVLGSIYIVLAYVLTDQPLEWERGVKFGVMCLLMAILSESFGLAIASRLSIVVMLLVHSV